MSLGLEVFRVLCEAGNRLEALRDGTPPGSRPWCALTECLSSIDVLIDALVSSQGLEDDNHAA